MQKRRLGNSGLEIAPLMFGGNVFGWTTDEPTSFALLDRFVAAGCNAIDTADVYSRWVSGHKGGESEVVLGRWLAARGGRDRVIVATKVGNDMPGVGKGLRKAHVLRSCEDSLKRLQTDYIDLYQSHIDDGATPLEETLAAYAELIAAGKVRAIGASNYKGARLREAARISADRKLPRYESLQPHYNLCERAEYERDLAPAVAETKVGVIPYYSLASGFLSGKYRSSADFGKSARGGGMQKYMNERGMRILAALDAVSARLRATPAAVALAWLMQRPGITAPIASATTLAQLDEILAATRLKLDAETVEALDGASA
jgi:aryl-alcohol dehydrogenase-like predicted oxidoreductase